MAGYPYMQYQQPIYGGYNPNQYQGVRMDYMQNQMQPNVQPAQMQNNANVQSAISQPGFVCRPVASKAEAQAVPTDFSGNILVMTDIANGAIYTKVLDSVNGSARFETYVRTSESKNLNQNEAHDYSSFFNSLDEKINHMNIRIDELFEKLDNKAKTPQKSTAKTVE